MVRVGFTKKILAAVVAAASLAVANSAVKAAEITIDSNFDTVQADTAISSVYTGTLTFSYTSSTNFTISVSDQPGAPLTYNSTGTAASGFLQNFTATVNVAANVVTGGSYTITFADHSLGQVGSVTGSITSGGVFTPPGGSVTTSSFTALSNTTFSPDLGGVSIISFANASPIPTTITTGSHLNVSLNPDGTAHFTVDATIAGASNPTPLPAAAWGGLGLMGALGVGAMARRRRA